uniref:Bidirectional sugar transporter SWEET n=2 Tax=Physcomitrium patens TaxID=3218 RepID=A0A7I4A942_PHYPA
MTSLVKIVFGVLGNITASFLFLSPVPTFWRIVKSRKVDDFSGMPYLTAALNTCLWTLYGLPFVSFQVLVVTVNAAGAGLEISYIIIYLMYSEGKARMRVVKFFAVMVCGFILMTGLVLGLVDSVDTRKTILGVMGAFLGSLMYAAPLTVMRMVIQTKSVEFMPFLLSLFVFLNSTTWTIYAGVPETDLYILIPNGLGLLLGTTQLVLYAMYRGSTPRKPSLPTFSYKLAVETPPKFAPAPDSKANRPLGPGNQKAPENV